jgi:hypothetical protein
MILIHVGCIKKLASFQSRSSPQCRDVDPGRARIMFDVVQSHRRAKSIVCAYSSSHHDSKSSLPDAKLSRIFNLIPRSIFRVHCHSSQSLRAILSICALDSVQVGEFCIAIA